MPPITEILSGLEQMAQRAFPIAVLWHVVVAVAVAALASGWRPSRRLAGALLALPLASAAAIGFAFGNPFNGAVLGALSMMLGLLALSAPQLPVRAAEPAVRAIGVCLIGFGWLYPHFLEGWPPVAYAIGAPLGLIPCPTLSLVIGFALLGRRLAGRAWSMVLAGAGFAYGLFGAMRLGVTIDLVLLAGAAALFYAHRRAGGQLSLPFALRRRRP